ncbi:hypothetical protein [Nocardioides sp. Arc9.136]|uniref:hypothetical protein n=1 Tax=Nocardioides sp. Arc9.136 TaxID=2996826 RepID=UPI002664EF2C|nr:hypothetical protein [Nocardioides sp. Arc9.136]WKN47149.1 hypothetical protein OSR43_13985 [Nocardioides sp. Arc9.136]
MDGFVTAYSETTGLKQRVPAHFIGHPVLGRGLRKTPRQIAGQAYPDGDPTTDWKVAQLEAYAAEHDINLTGATTKAESVALITEALAATQNPTGTPPAATETPA